MHIKAYQTPLVGPGDDILAVIKAAIPQLAEKSVLVVTSKIISYAQKKLVPKVTSDLSEKHALVKSEADWFLPSSYSKYDIMLAIKQHTLTVNAGVDESNADGQYVLWPENLQASVNQIWQFCRENYQVKELGVIMTDSRTWPLRWGVIGTCLASCGFKQLTDYRGQLDLFGRQIHMVQINVAEAVAAAAVLEMGEVAERTPLAVVEQIQHIQFQDRPPSAAELAALQIETADDVYGPFLTSVNWEKGGGSR